MITLPAPNKLSLRKLSRTTHILSTAEATEMASSRVCAMWKRLWILLPVLLLTGCTAADKAALQVNMGEMTWQTAAIIVLALLANPYKLIGKLTEILQKVPGVEPILRTLRILKTPDTSPGTLTSAEVLESLVSIVNQMPEGPLRDDLARLLPKAASVPVEAVTDGK